MENFTASKKRRGREVCSAKQKKEKNKNAAKKNFFFNFCFFRTFWISSNFFQFSVNKVVNIFFAVKRLDIFVMLAGADISHRNSERFSNRENHSAFRSRVVFCDYNRIHANRLVENFRLPNRILPCLSVNHENFFLAAVI